MTTRIYDLFMMCMTITNFETIVMHGLNQSRLKKVMEDSFHPLFEKHIQYNFYMENLEFITQEQLEYLKDTFNFTRYFFHCIFGLYYRSKHLSRYRNKTHPIKIINNSIQRHKFDMQLVLELCLNTCGKNKGSINKDKYNKLVFVVNRWIFNVGYNRYRYKEPDVVKSCIVMDKTLRIGYDRWVRSFNLIGTYDQINATERLLLSHIY